MPPQPKLQKATGKSTTALSSNVGTIMDPAVEQQFEIELCWCIQQLQTSLNSGKLTPKQVQETTRTLNALMSNSSPVIKKRQLMRLTFGDYRAKMAAEDKKLTKYITNIKITTASPHKNSTFFKKSLFGSDTASDFKFDFNVDASNSSLENGLSKVEIKDCDKNFRFVSSKNEFRFEFVPDQNA